MNIVCVSKMNYIIIFVDKVEFNDILKDKKTFALVRSMDKNITVKIDKDLHGRDIKYVIHKHIGLSATLVKRLKRTADGILLNGEAVTVRKKVCAGDELALTLYDEGSDSIVPKNIPISVLYEDEDIIAVNKPRSMPTHPSLNHYEDTLANGIMYYFRNESFTFRAITRLDRDTSGVVLVAKNPLSAQILSDDMKNKKIHKEYIAVVNGVPKPPCGTVSVPIKRLEKSVILRCAAPDGREAITEYEVEKTFRGLSLVKLRPVTGRTHQLRVHMSFIGTPIYGDDLYGAPQTEEETRLHCRRIDFLHPTTKEKISITAPTSDDIKTLLEKN